MRKNGIGLGEAGKMHDFKMIAILVGVMTGFQKVLVLKIMAMVIISTANMTLTIKQPGNIVKMNQNPKE